MTASRSFQVDFADREDIRAKLPMAEGILRDMERSITEQLAEFESWKSYVELLRTRVGASAPPPPLHPSMAPGTPTPPAEPASAPAATPDTNDQGGRPQLQDMVVDALNRVGRPIRAKDLREILVNEGHDLTPDSVSNALWYAAERLGTVVRVKRGTYAPLSYIVPGSDGPIGQLAVSDDSPQAREAARIRAVAERN